MSLGQGMTLFSVGVGGFLGAIARYALAGGINHWIGDAAGWPIGTIVVNVLGSFALAVFGVWVIEQVGFPDNLRLMIATGFFGAFTTFSTFANESINLIRSGDYVAGVGNILATNGLCLIGVVIGLLFVNRVLI